MAWHEFMVAAHEGVPIAPLPGTWKSAPPAVDQSVPDTEAVGDFVARPAPQAPADTVAPEPVAPVNEASGQFELPDQGIQMPVQDEETSSIRRPVPPADVGGAPVKRKGSILDVILGNGG